MGLYSEMVNTGYTYIYIYTIPHIHGVHTRGPLIQIFDPT